MLQPDLLSDEEKYTWHRKGFPLIRAGQIDIFASRKSCNVEIQRNSGNILSDHLEFMVTCSPLTAVLLCTLEYCVIVMVYATLYWLGGDTCIAGEGFDQAMDMKTAFFLSVHTQTTAGYGVIAPFSIYCNICILAHCWTGTIFIALVTSILLLNITRPNVNVVFSSNAVICNLHEYSRTKHPELHFQIIKDSNYSVANVEISANLWDYSKWPVIKRQALLLNAPTLSWMEYGVHNVHVVDNKSPLRNIVNQIRESGTVPNSFNILVTINCVQSATGSVLTRMYSYCEPNIQFNKRFKPLLVDKGDYIALMSVEESQDLMEDTKSSSKRFAETATALMMGLKFASFKKEEEEEDDDDDDDDEEEAQEPTVAAPVSPQPTSSFASLTTSSFSPKIKPPPPAPDSPASDCNDDDTITLEPARGQ